MPEDTFDDRDLLEEIVGFCGSFLTVREGTVYFVHQSAKDYVLKQAFNEIFPSGREKAHYIIFSRSLQVMSKTPRRDMYRLRALAYSIERVEVPDPDPLAASRYSCIHWVDYLCDWNPNFCANHIVDLQDGGVVDEFVKKKYLYWLGALSLCKITRIRITRAGSRCAPIHPVSQGGSENSPLQAYASALMFSPTRSLIKGLFRHEEPKWITAKPPIGDEWSAYLQTLEGHRKGVTSVAFSRDSTCLASASFDKTVKI
ncbi:hypothetical protein MMC17_009742 [Xylographa soralifera]|nr:hypothetical protein [Xylographa soralifera]